MVKKVDKDASAARPTDPEAEDRKRLKSLAFSGKLLSRAAAKALSPLEPSKTVLKHQGRDIVKKGQRKNRFLFSFPGLLAPLSGGKIGELTRLNSRNPVLYLDFPQGRMKLFGTIVYPKNKYLTLQFMRSSKGVPCEDSFENMVVFSEAWWIGRKEENPEEARLDFPKELNEGKTVGHDFKGGAGAVIGEKSANNKTGKDYSEPLSPDTELRDDASEESVLVAGNNTKVVMEETSTRRSARTAGKALNYEESSPGDDPLSSDPDKLEMVEEKVTDKVNNAAKSSRLSMNEGPSLGTSNSHSSEEEFVDTKIQSTGKVKQSLLSVKSSEDKSLNKRGALVQATLSTLFEKVAKKSKCPAGDSQGQKGANNKRQQIISKQISKKAKSKGLEKKKIQVGKKKTGRGAVAQQKQSQVEDDDIEEISSESQEGDEDWTSMRRI